MDEQGSGGQGDTAGGESIEDRLTRLEQQYRDLVDAVYEIGEAIADAPGSRVQWASHLKIGNLYHKMRFR